MTFACSRFTQPAKVTRSRRRTSWRTFLRAHVEVIAASDFFTVEVWTRRGLVTHYVLFVIEHATRAVHLAGVTTNPNGAFMAQIARNLTDEVDGFLRGLRCLIVDRDSKFTEQFDAILARAGVGVTRIAYHAPNMNAFAERWVRSVKAECTDRMVFFGVESLRRALAEYVAHYNAERPHQGIGNELIVPAGPPMLEGEVECDERLGGLLRHYHRAASPRSEGGR